MFPTTLKGEGHSSDRFIESLCRVTLLGLRICGANCLPAIVTWHLAQLDIHWPENLWGKPLKTHINL